MIKNPKSLKIFRLLIKKIPHLFATNQSHSYQSKSKIFAEYLSKKFYDYPLKCF